MLSLNREAGLSDNARYAKQTVLEGFRTFNIDAAHTVMGFDVFDDVALVEIRNETAWDADCGPLHGQPGAPETCQHCVTRRAEVELQIMQSQFDMYYYPFDVQVIRAQFIVEGGACAGIKPTACCRAPAHF